MPMKTRQVYPYWNPYIVGVGIGILIILSFVVTGWCWKLPGSVSAD